MKTARAGTDATWRTGDYPKPITLRDGSTVTLRPVEDGDEEPLLTFFRAIPENERFFLKEDVTSPAVIRGWIAGRAQRAFAILAVDGDRVLADAVLVRRRGQARAHLADVRLVVAQDFRKQGLGTAMLSELCDVARDSGLNGVLFEAVEGPQDQALHAADNLGFIRLGRIHGGAIDQHGTLHDLVLLAMPLRRWRGHAEF